MNNPDNPFGSLMDKNGLINIVNIAKVAGAYIKNLKILEQWVEEEPHISWYKPQAQQLFCIMILILAVVNFVTDWWMSTKHFLFQGVALTLNIPYVWDMHLKVNIKKWTRLCKSVFKETGRRKDSNSLMEISEKSRSDIFWNWGIYHHPMAVIWSTWIPVWHGCLGANTIIKQ